MISKKHKYEIKSRRLRSQILIFLMFLVFKENRILIEEDNPSEKILMVKEELDRIDRDGIRNLEDLLRLVLINEECWNSKVVLDSGELARNITRKKRSDVLQGCRYPLCNKCYTQEYFFNKHLEYCESVM